MSLSFNTKHLTHALAWGLQIVPSMKATPLTGAVKGRVAVTHFSGRAHLLLGFHLFSRSPGIKSIDISFLEPPVFDVRLTPMGVTVTDFPGVLAAIKVSSSRRQPPKWQCTFCLFSGCPQREQSHSNGPQTTSMCASSCLDHRFTRNCGPMHFCGVASRHCSSSNKQQ